MFSPLRATKKVKKNDNVLGETLDVDEDELGGLFRKNFGPGTTVVNSGHCQFEINSRDTEVMLGETVRNSYRATKPFCVLLCSVRILLTSEVMQNTCYREWDDFDC